MSKNIQTQDNLVDLKSSEWESNRNRDWIGIALVVLLVAGWPLYFFIKDKFFPPDPAGLRQHEVERIIKHYRIKDGKIVHDSRPVF